MEREYVNSLSKDELRNEVNKLLDDLDKNIEELIKEANLMEEKILNRLDRLPNSGCECHCDERKTYTYVHWGDFPELIQVCYNCGGMIV